MSLLSVPRYREITGDTDTATARAETACVDAQGLLEDFLGRPLEQATYTHRLILESDGNVYPFVTPVISTAAGYTVINSVVYGAIPAMVPFIGLGPTSVPYYVDLEYTAGFDPAETDSSVAGFLPRYIERDLAWAANALLHNAAQVAAMSPEAKSMTLGDASIAYADDIPSPTLGGFDWSCETARWKRRSP